MMTRQQRFLETMTFGTPDHPAAGDYFAYASTRERWEREERKKYGKRIAFFGGIDKRALAGSREEMEAEVLPKLRAGFADGGFIPACDHGIPPDVSFDNYRYFRELVRRCAEE